MNTEFDCVMCGRHIVSIGGPPGLTLCGTCAIIPGWHLDPELRKAIDDEVDVSGHNPVTPEEFMNMELHLMGYGHATVGTLVTLEELQQAHAAQGEFGMWQLAQRRLIERDHER